MKESQFYEIQKLSDEGRRMLLERLPELELLPSKLRDAALVAWNSSVLSSSHADYDGLPFSQAVPAYSLLQHVQEVTQCGLLLSEFAQRRWGTTVDPDVLLSVLLLHDVDKPLLYEISGSSARLSAGAGAVPHGVLGAMLLRELGFCDAVVAIVATHAVYSPFHSDQVEGWILHYADLFAADHVMRANGLTPFYQGHR